MLILKGMLLLMGVFLLQELMDAEEVDVDIYAKGGWLRDVLGGTSASGRRGDETCAA